MRSSRPDADARQCLIEKIFIMPLPLNHQIPSAITDDADMYGSVGVMAAMITEFLIGLKFPVVQRVQQVDICRMFKMYFHREAAFAVSIWNLQHDVQSFLLHSVGCFRYSKNSKRNKKRQSYF